MPKIHSKIISAKYLLNVLLNKIFTIKTCDIKVGTPLKKLSSLELYDELLGCCDNLGFDEYHLPDKTWMVNVLKTI